MADQWLRLWPGRHLLRFELITAQDFSGGDVVKIPFATPWVHTSLTGNTLLFPAGVTVGANGTVFVSNQSAEVPVGQVLRLTNH